jgi:hypothetical protein
MNSRLPLTIKALFPFALTGVLSACSGSGAPGAPAIGTQPSIGTQSRNGRAIAPAAQSNALMYLAVGNTISIYDQAGKNQSPIGSLTNGLDGPSGIYVDGNDDLYVANASSGNVVVFHKGDSAPYKTLTGIGPGNNNDVTTDENGTVYAVQGQSKTIYVFANGSKSPTSTLTARGEADEVATDSKGDLFVQSYNRKVEEFVAHHSHSKTLSFGTYSSGGLAVDANNDLIVCDGGGDDGFSGGVSVYAPPYTGQPTLQTSLFNGIFGCAVNRATGNVWAATHGNVGFGEEFNLQLKEKDLIALGNSYPGGIAVESEK